MERIVINESPRARDTYGDLMDALSAELKRQASDCERRGDRMLVSGEIDLRGLAHAVLHSVTTTFA